MQISPLFLNHMAGKINNDLEQSLAGKPVLAIETATPVCSVALRLANGDFLERSAEGKGVHSELTFVFIDELLAQEKVAVADLGAVIVSAGPGSYTGLRVASSAVKGLLFGTDVPLYACNTLGGIALGGREAMREGRFHGQAATSGSPDHKSGSSTSGSMSESHFMATGCEAVIDARRNHLYHQSWSFREDGVFPESDVAVRELREVLENRNQGYILAGTGLDRLKKLAGNSSEIRDIMPDLPLPEIVSARHILAAAGVTGDPRMLNLIKKVAPEHFEPYYYSGL
jgi:tRNA threonylcarbamoyladenosine biosynthesis protein TsaB